LIVHLVGTREALTAVGDAIRGWLKRQRDASVKLTIGGDTFELTGASSAQQDRAFDLFVASHDTA
jgi:hypothetical protein